MVKNNFLEIDGNYLEGGGQILRTALSLSVITSKPVRVFNIRAKRPQPGLKPQHLFTLDTLREITHSSIKGLKLGLQEVEFIPSKEIISSKHIDIDIGTAGSIGLVLQSILPVAAFKSEGLSSNIKGGTCGLGAIPVDYYSCVVFPILLRCGLKAELSILRRGYYPKGGGEVSVCIDKIKYPKKLELDIQGNIKRIQGKSLASHNLMRRDVAQRQAKQAQDLLKRDFNCPIQIDAEYVDTYSDGSEINLYAYTDTGCILGADARGEIKITAEDVGKEAYLKLKKEIESGAACDLHLADNLIPWLALLGGKIKTSEISRHTQTNIWVCEQFFGKIFKVEGNAIEVTGRQLWQRKNSQ